jgi:hypothetical protein
MPIHVDPVTVTGVLVQFDITAPYQSEYQLTPRGAPDITVAIPGSASVPIQIDGEFGDWSGAAVIQDPPGDGGGSGIDITHVSIANDPEWLFLRLDTGVEIEPDEGHDLRFALDTDDSEFTGLPVGGIGAELVWSLGQRTGTYYSGGSSAPAAHAQLGLLVGPTVSGTDFEGFRGLPCAF